MPAATVGAALEEAVRVSPDKPFLHAGPQTLTFRDVDLASDRLAGALLARGLSKGDRIGLFALNQPEWLLTYFAAAKIGAVVVALSPRYREREFTYMLSQSGARALVGLAALPDFDFAGLFATLRDRLPHLSDYVFLGGARFPGSLGFDELIEADFDAAAVDAAKARVDPSDPLLILYTSGTTGRPKGATITHRSILASGGAQAAHCDLTADDVILGQLPFNHVGGITCTITTALVARASVPLIPAFSAQAALDAVARHRVTVLGAVPTMFVLMLGHPERSNYDLSSVRLCIAGGSNVEPALCEQLARAFPGARLSNLYGLSECSGACVLSHRDDDVATMARTLGVMIGDFEARVVGPDGAALPPGEDGELQVRGDCVAAGYWNMPEETAQTFLPGGWLATGDMVRREADGHLVLMGRKKEMYIQGGFNVYPVEIENVLTTHPKVAMAAGIGVPDPVLGEIGRCYVVPKPGVEPPTPAELEAFCRARLADYKVPRQFVLAEQLPLTPLGKIHKALLKERFLAEHSAL